MSIKMTIAVMFAAVITLFSAPLVLADDSSSGWLKAGLRSGPSDDNGVDFIQYEAFAIYRLPWQWPGPGHWRWSMRLEGTAAILRGAGKSGLVSSLGPVLALTSPQGRWTIDGGSSAAGLSRYRFGGKNLGGRVQFITHLGIEYLLQPRLGVGYRLQHMSNADLYPKNPGVDLHLLQISYHFQ
jgi:hypothetical protein